MINLDDWILKQLKTQKAKFYRCSCDACGADRGYQEKKAANRLCKACYIATIDHDKVIVAATKANLGRTQDPEHVKIRVAKLKGKSHSPEAKQKMSAAAKVRKTKPFKRSDLWKAKISKTMTGRILSTEVRKAISDKLTGVKPNRVYEKLSEEVRIQISCKQRGIKVSEFGDFATKGKRNEKYHEVIQIRNECFKRDNYTCKRCALSGGTLNAHHLNSWKFFPKERYELDNLVTLCKACHVEFHSKYGNGLKKPNTSDQFTDFLAETNII